MSEYEGGYTRPEGIFDESSRKPTDKFWLIPLVLCFVAYIVCCSVSISQSTKFVNSTSTDGNQLVCGIDSAVLDKPNKIFLDQRQCDDASFVCAEPWICVKSCPKGSFDLATCKNSKIEDVKKQLICDNDETLKNIRKCSDIKFAKCVEWYNNADDLLGTCSSVDEKHTDSTVYNDFYGFLRSMIIPLLVAVVFALSMSGIFIFTLKWSAGCVFWSFIGILIASLVLGIIGCIYGIIVVPANATDKEKHDAKVALGILLAVLCVFLLFFGIILFCARRKIKCGIELVKESSRAVCNSLPVVGFPFITYIARVTLIILTVYALIKASLIFTNLYEVKGQPGNCVCSAAYSHGDICTPTQFNADCKDSSGAVCETMYCGLRMQLEPAYPKVLMAIIAFSAMWMVAFIHANLKMILAHVFGNWYWNFNKGEIPADALPNATVQVLKNHTGSAAFGSLIITICRILRSLLNSKRRDNQGDIAGIFLRLISECIRYMAQAFLSLVEFISDKAFVMCAIAGTDFWNSVKNVSQIMLKDIPLVVATEYVGDIILGICKFVVGILAALVFYVTATGGKVQHDADQFFYIISAVLVFVLAFDLAGVMLTSYDIAIDTLLLCALQDYTHSRAEKAYFQSNSLNDLLIKPPPQVA